MRKQFKEFSRATRLHHLAAGIQDGRRALLRALGKGTIPFQLTPELSFPIDIAARRAFTMFQGKDQEMQQEMAAFIELSRGKNSLLDVGGLYGIFSLAFTEVNPEARAHVIEPSPKCQEVLHLNQQLNTSKQISAYPVALGAANGRLPMHYEWVHLIADHGHAAKGLSAQMMTMDHFLQSEAIVPDLVKIDVDGYEGPVLAGASQFLKTTDAILFLELHGHWIRRYGHMPEDLLNQLREAGYTFHDTRLKPIKDPKAAFNVFANRIICIKR